MVHLVSDKPSRTIIIVDDDPASASAALQALEADGYQMEWAASAADATEKLRICDPALVILDGSIPGLASAEALRRLRLSDRYICLILASAGPPPAEIARGLDSGADDYIAKPYDPLVLAARVRAQLRIKDLNDRLKEANERLLQLVDNDDLTELYNMRSIYDRLDQELARAERFGRETAAVMMDIDNFKLVNDSNDHLFGSFALREIGKIVRATIRRVDLAARYGGDEFLIILPETGIEGARIFADRLRKAIEAYLFQNETASIRLTASFGLAVSSPVDRGITSQGLVRCADLALYEAKSEGKNCVREHRGSFRDARKKSAG